MFGNHIITLRRAHPDIQADVPSGLLMSRYAVNGIHVTEAGGLSKILESMHSSYGE